MIYNDTCRVTLNDIDKLTIVHELEHVVRYRKYGIKGKKNFDEISVHKSAIKRIIKKDGKVLSPVYWEEYLKILSV
jgi:hypothetical protein